MNLRRVLISSVALAPLLAAVHCSLINSFDDVATATVDGAVTPTDDASDAEVTSDAASDAVTVDAGDGEAAVKIVGGAIVAIASDIDGGKAVDRTQLVIIDPATGARFPNTKSEFADGDGGTNMWPANFEAVVYDRDKDFWYIVVAEQRVTSDEPPLLTVMVRRLDEKTGQWKPWGGTNSPISKTITHLASPYFGNGQFVAMNGSLVYLADSALAPAQVADIVEIAVDGDSGTPTQRDAGGARLNGVPTRVIASPMSKVVNYVYAPAACSDAGVLDAAACELTIDSVTTPLASNSVTHRTTPRYPVDDVRSGIPAGAAYEHGTVRDFYLAVPSPLAVASTTTIYGYDPRSFAPGTYPSGDGAKLAISGSDAFRRFAPLAVAECSPVVFMVEQNGDANVLALPLTAGSTSVRARHDFTNANVAFDPFTSSAIVYGVASGGQQFEFTSFRYSDTGANRFERRDDRTKGVPWAPPSGIAIRKLDVRRPRDFACP